MRYANTLYVLGWLIFVLAGAMALPAIVAVGAGEDAEAFSFMAMSTVTAFFGGGFVFALEGSLSNASMRENMLLTLIAMIFLPLFAAIPIFASGAVETMPAAYFEAVSGLTTTGATIIKDLDNASSSILLWRAILQWLGGLGILVIAVSVLAPFGAAGRDIQRALAPLGDEGPSLERFILVMRMVAVIYLSATVLGVIGIAFGGVPMFDAVCIGLSSISTGGFATTNNGIRDFHAPASEIVVALVMFYGATNFLLHAAAMRGRVSAYLSDPEPRNMLFAVILLAFFFAVANAAGVGVINDPGAGFLLFNAISLVTTTGYWLGDLTALTLTPLPLIIGFAMIGGSMMSTAGGVHHLRLSILLKQSVREFRRLVHPHSVSRASYGGAPITFDMMSGVWAIFVAMFVSFAALSIVLSGMGFEPDAAMAASISALSNIGPLYQWAGENASPLFAAPDSAKLVMCAAMIAGRVEILLILSFLNPAFWRT
jgi:trk system potassium uptake protein TrkH